MTATESLLETIRTLDEPTALEAAQLLAAALEAKPAYDTESPIFAAPLEHRPEIAEMCRLLLMVAATGTESRALTEEAIQGAGRKQLVLGGAEIVALASLAIGALQVYLSGGRTAEEEIMTVERQADGSELTTIRRSVKYGVSGHVGQLLRGALNMQGAGGSATAPPPPGANPV